MKRRQHASRLFASARMALFACCLAIPALAGPFSPIKYVNGLAITQYELDQRVTFMKLLGQPGDIEAQSLSGLIDDRIKQSLARQYDFTLPTDAVHSGMDEFASQANMNAEQFIKALSDGGVDQQTFRDFVESGLIWREIVRGKIAPTVHITDAEVDRALAGSTPLSAKSVHLSEIVLQASGAGRGPALAQAHHIQLELRAGADFADLARKYSTGHSAKSGGALDWLFLSQLKPDAAKAVRSLDADKVSEPVVLDDTVVIYKMIESKQQDLPPPGVKVIDYAELLIPDSPDEIAKTRNGADSCDALAGLAKSLPADRYQRQTLPIGKLPADVAGALVTLDPGESSVALNRGSYRVFLMLCRRGAPEAEQPTRDEVRLQLTNQRLGVLADIYLEELRRDATIADP